MEAQQTEPTGPAGQPDQPGPTVEDLLAQIASLRAQLAAVTAEPKVVWVTHDPCDCEDPGCYGKSDLAVFLNPQTAAQEADIRSQRYGGHPGRPDMHVDKIRVSTKVSQRW